MNLNLNQDLQVNKNLDFVKNYKKEILDYPPVYCNGRLHLGHVSISK